MSENLSKNCVLVCVETAKVFNNDKGEAVPYTHKAYYLRFDDGTSSQIHCKLPKGEGPKFQKVLDESLAKHAHKISK